MINSIYFRRKSKVLLTYDLATASPKVSMQYVATLFKALQSLGYMPTPRLIKKLKILNTIQFETFYLDIMSSIKKELGLKKYTPMYPNFPAQVMEMNEVELFINAIIHYWTLALPVYEKKERLPLFEECEVLPLDLGSEEDFYNIFRNLMASNASLSSAENEDLEWLFENNFDKISNYIPDAIPFKETLVLISKLCGNQIDKVSHLYKTATDVLRLAVALSDGDITLSENTKFIKFNRKARRLLLSLLEHTTNPTEDMWKYKGNWIRLGEILHPGEYKNKFPIAFASFQILRDEVKYRTFNSKVEASISNHNLNETLELLKSRPGEFARRLDYVLRTFNESNEVMIAFDFVISKVSTRVLLQLQSFFADRNIIKNRMFIIKGAKSKNKIIDNNLPFMDDVLRLSIIYLCNVELQNRFAKLPNLGKVYIDPDLVNYSVPMMLRNASKALKTIPIGSKLSLPDKNFIRFFLWWKDGDSRTDIDLTTPFYDENWKYVDHISYTELKSSKLNACHSGDITSAPNGASEFIDVDIKSAIAAGARYVVMSVYSYSNQPFSELPECFAGWMSRDKSQSGEIYEPRTVEHKFDLTSNTRVSIPMIIDLVDRKVIWLDLSLNKQLDYNCIERSTFSIQRLGETFMERTFPNLENLFKLHIAGRKGIIVSDINEANVIFTSDQKITNEKATIITPFDMDVILSEYIS